VLHLWEYIESTTHMRTLWRWFKCADDDECGKATKVNLNPDGVWVCSRCDAQ
jgi:hypothetical protein